MVSTLEDHSFNQKTEHNGVSLLANRATNTNGTEPGSAGQTDDQKANKRVETEFGD